MPHSVSKQSINTRYNNLRNANNKHASCNNFHLQRYITHSEVMHYDSIISSKCASAYTNDV